MSSIRSVCRCFCSTCQHYIASTPHHLGDWRHLTPALIHPKTACYFQHTHRLVRQGKRQTCVPVAIARRQTPRRGPLRTATTTVPENDARKQPRRMRTVAIARRQTGASTPAAEGWLPELVFPLLLLNFAKEHLPVAIDRHLFFCSQRQREQEQTNNNLGETPSKKRLTRCGT